MTVYDEIQEVYQLEPYGDRWFAGYGFTARDGQTLISGGCYTATEHTTMKEARAAARDHAEGYRNTVLTLGGCTFDRLPPIKIMRVGQ